MQFGFVDVQHVFHAQQKISIMEKFPCGRWKNASEAEPKIARQKIIFGKFSF